MSVKSIEEQQIKLEQKKLYLKCATTIISVIAIAASFYGGLFQLTKKAELEAMFTVSKMLVQPEGSDEERDYRAEITNIQFIYLLEETFSNKDVAILADFDPYHPYKLINKISSDETKTALCNVIYNNLVDKGLKITADEEKLKNDCKKILVPAKQ